MARVVHARSLEEALGWLAAGDGWRPLAGGVGVLLARALGGEVADRWVAVGGLRELRELRPEAATGSVIVGAALTLEELAEGIDRGVVPPLLAAAAAAAANPGIRAVATLAGNVVAGGASSDPVAALIALGAEAEIVGPTGVHRVAVEGVVADGLAPDGSLIRAFRLPSAPVRWGWQRMTIRGAMDRSSASVAVAIGPHGVRVAVSCAAGRPFRLASVEAEPDPAGVRAAAARDLESIELADDDRASAAYRRHVIPVLAERALAAAVARA